ncbi:uncharacterized protein E0L32_005828 [Thyridium curvatum]|uniref:Lysine-specific metallo-endopeptidase domain-containing protein n=1 Tax=Thyridium curvatum TaxID=1093900 RepID=A0A507AS50_9PEZI|nr:uncharacterized protein E0L32_005828 [Thyridium curvatum]TPX13625.1 hypothetical protein E0L32_005828 [Thyridium curvatum]
MPSTRNATYVAATILMHLAFSSLASPTGLGSSASLGRRYTESINGCNPDQTTKLNQDFADAASFALHAYNDMSKDHAATEGDGADEDLLQAQHLWGIVASNNDPTNPPYKFSVRCAPNDDQECSSRTTQSFAITDARPQDGDTARQMKICPIYFTHDWSKQSTTSHKWIPNPGRRDDSWCKPEAKFRDFSVGGLVLLHEMTHLDAVTKAASYPSVHDDDGNFDTHATEDVQGVPPDNNPPLQARNLAKIWQQGKEGDCEDLTQPFRNAESLAAAALEAYAMKFCKLGNIDI